MSDCRLKGKPLEVEEIDNINHLWFNHGVEKRIIAIRKNMSRTTVAKHIKASKEEWFEWRSIHLPQKTTGGKFNEQK
jgi:hypothetical protein